MKMRSIPYNPRTDKTRVRPLPDDQEPRTLTSRAGAERLARELTEWWHARGFPQVVHWVESSRGSRSSDTSHSTTWCVRSNLVNGLPPSIPHRIEPPQSQVLGERL
jgi:hypothetical protein